MMLCLIVAAWIGLNPPGSFLVDTGSSADVLYLRLTIEWVTIECAFALLTVH